MNAKKDQGNIWDKLEHLRDDSIEVPQYTMTARLKKQEKEAVPQCCLMEKEYYGYDFYWRERFELVEELFESAHCDINLQRCKVCGAMYLEHYLEITSLGFDDSWVFFVPASQEDIELVRKDWTRMLDMVQTSRHITWNPVLQVYWKEGSEMAIIMGPAYCEMKSLQKEDVEREEKRKKEEEERREAMARLTIGEKLEVLDKIARGEMTEK